MSLDITGYNATFKAFADFAKTQMDAGNEKAVARTGAGGAALGGRAIVAATTDRAFAFTRSQADKSANDIARDLFRQAVVDLFGGEANIPPSVKDALLLKDYGVGKPLTARRIAAVKTAIESLVGDKFSGGESVARAKAAGYMDSELPKLARIATLYQQATGCTNAEAEAAALDSKSNASRLFKTGGRFVANAENFKAGLKLMDGFDAWFQATRNAFKSKNAADKPLSALNGSEFAFALERNGAGLQKFIFDEIARNPALNLAAKNPEDVFGVKNNPASRFVLSGRLMSLASTLAQVPPEKRALLYKIDALFHPLYDRPVKYPPEISQNVIFVSRILKNYDALAALDSKGKLTRAAAFDVLYPDMPVKGAKDVKAVNDFDNVFMQRIAAEFKNSGATGAAMATYVSMLCSSGATLDEVIQAMKENRELPNAPFRADVALELANIGDLGNGGLVSMRGDIYRPSLPTSKTTGEKFPGLEGKFVFRIAGETVEIRAQTERSARPLMDDVSNRLRALCGAAHPEQLDALGIALGQGPLSRLKGGLDPYGIVSDEHMAVKYDISRNDRTGAITVKVSNPDNLPVKFSWTTTIDIDGNTFTEPMRVDHGQYEAKALAQKTISYIANKTPEKDETVAKQIVKDALAACGDDFDAKQIVSENILKICIDGKASLRTPEKIKARVDGILANLDEVRKAADGDAALEKAGLNFMQGLRGKSVPPEFIGRMMKASAKIDVGSFANLTVSSKPVQFAKAVVEMRTAVERLMVDENAFDVLDGEDEMVPARDLVATVALSRLPASQLAKIAAALDGGTVQKMMAMFDDFGADRYPVPKESLSLDRRDAIGGQTQNLRVKLQQYEIAVKELLGRPSTRLDAFQGAFDKKAAGRDELFKEVLKHADKALAVQQNIENGVAAAGPNAANAYSKAGEDNAGEVDGLIQVAVLECAENADAVQVVAKNIDTLLVSNDAKLRSEGDVRKRAAAIAANFRELETLAANNPAIYEAGKAMMAGMGGKTLPAGMIAKLVAAANEADIDRMRKISSRSTGLDIHHAVTQFRDNIVHAMESSGAETAAGGPDEKQACRNFVAALMMRRCGDKALRAMQGAFAGDKTGKMLALYSAIANGDYNEGLDRQAAFRLEDRAGSHETHIAVFKESIDRALGAPLGTGLVPFGDAFNADAISGPDILDDLMN